MPERGFSIFSLRGLLKQTQVRRVPRDVLVRDARAQTEWLVWPVFPRATPGWMLRQGPLPPTNRTKPPTTRTLFALLDSLACSVVRSRAT
jgi:hypothetical protein